MSWCVLGAGLVGCFLGAAGGADRVILRRGISAMAAATVRLPIGMRTWSPVCEDSPSTSPLLLACRVHHSPWHTLAGRPVKAAQNGLGQPVPVVVCFMALDRDADGAIGAVGVRPRLVLAKPERCWHHVIAAWQRTGIEVEVVDDVLPAQWEKTILNATVGPLCLALGLTMAQVWADPANRALALAATSEGAWIATAHGVVVPDGIEVRAERFFAQVGGHRPSVVTDPGELPWILGHLLNIAELHQVPCPSLSRIAELVSAGAAR